MTDFRRHLDEYLKLRRALGFKLNAPEYHLNEFVAHLESVGALAITADLAINWASLRQDVQPITWAHRLGAVRGFARYLWTLEPATEVPPSGIWSATQRRPTPYLYSQQEVVALLEACRRLQPPIMAAMYETFFGLLAVSGMRVGEVLNLECDDVDLEEGVLTVREAKFGKSRLVPLHPSTTRALRSYADLRDRTFSMPSATTFFLSITGRRLQYRVILKVFTAIAVSIGVRSDQKSARMHDLRHAFAVRTLIELHRSGADIHPHMATLSTYLGHENPASTYWYLSAAPELMEWAAARLNNTFGASS